MGIFKIMMHFDSKRKIVGMGKDIEGLRGNHNFFSKFEDGESSKVCTKQTNVKL